MIRSFPIRPRTVVAALLLPPALVLSACGGGEDDDRFAEAQKKANTSTTQADTQTSATSGEPSATAVTSTTQAPALPPGESLLAGVAAFQEALGSGGPIQALEFTIHFPVDSASYASLQSQDPAKPTNVDNRDWRNGKVGSPQPVQLSGGGDLAANLFAFDSVNWQAIAGVLPGAQAVVEQKMGTTFENSDGVTHLIATKDLPFSANTVVRVYVDGGDRTSGGYIQYLADGTLDKVQA